MGKKNKLNVVTTASDFGFKLKNKILFNFDKANKLNNLLNKYFQKNLAILYYNFWIIKDNPDCILINFMYHGELSLPKKINYIYGYRTNRTMLNDDIWNFANSLFCVTLLKYSGVALLVMILMIFINEPLMSSWLPMAFMIFTLLIAIISVEKKLNEEFDNEGNRKSRRQ